MVVRDLWILAPGSVPVSEPAGTDPVPAAVPTGPVRTRETASDGYRRALAAHQEAAPSHRVDPAIAEAVERQTDAMRELSRRAFPETNAVPDDALAPIEAARILFAVQPVRRGVVGGEREVGHEGDDVDVVGVVAVLGLFALRAPRLPRAGG
ncbi:hypothetical protein ABZX95_49710 [Streptomyces sp. NPDC004232]|uniref:hypothetical protein n=1 Tax=Streptomyces sp. NPDC004232 TaxID=3154454 RepID=UPI00339FAA3B